MCTLCLCIHFEIHFSSTQFLCLQLFWIIFFGAEVFLSKFVDEVVWQILLSNVFYHTFGHNYLFCQYFCGGNFTTNSFEELFRADPFQIFFVDMNYFGFNFFGRSCFSNMWLKGSFSLLTLTIPRIAQLSYH